MSINFLIQFTGIAVGTVFLTLLVWSALVPQRQIWPPQNYTRLTSAITWLATGIVFGAALWLGIAGWGDLALPGWVRFGAGLAVVVLGNLIVWPAAFRFGFDQTSGSKGDLMTSGLYRYSRNPRYVGDCLMFAGWALLSASAAALPVIAIGIAALIAAPFAEESWLRQIYGKRYIAYERCTPRFIGFCKGDPS